MGRSITEDDLREARAVLASKPEHTHMTDAEYLSLMLHIGEARSRRLAIAVHQNVPTNETPGVKSRRGRGLRRR